MISPSLVLIISPNLPTKGGVFKAVNEDMGQIPEALEDYLHLFDAVVTNIRRRMTQRRRVRVTKMTSVRLK